MCVHEGSPCGCRPCGGQPSNDTGHLSLWLSPPSARKALHSHSMWASGSAPTLPKPDSQPYTRAAAPIAVRAAAYSLKSLVMLLNKPSAFTILLQMPTPSCMVVKLVATCSACIQVVYRTRSLTFAAHEQVNAVCFAHISLWLPADTQAEASGRGDGPSHESLQMLYTAQERPPITGIAQDGTLSAQLHCNYTLPCPTSPRFGSIPRKTLGVSELQWLRGRATLS